MKTIAFVVTTPPNSNLTATAFNIVKAALQENDNVVGVFFYQDGVLNASKHLSLPNDEFQITKQWQKLNIEHNLELHVCVTAAEKRGLSDEIENPATESSSNYAPCFTLSGLGELVELASKADHVVQL